MIDKVSLVFLTKLQHLSLGFVLNFEELQVDGSNYCNDYSGVFIDRIYDVYLHIWYTGIPGIPQYHVCLESKLFHDATA